MQGKGVSILGDPRADSGGERKSKRADKYGTKKSKERFSPFFTILRAILFRPFRLSLAPTICPWVSEDEVLEVRKQREMKLS